MSENSSESSSPDATPRVGVVIVAAGSGSRMGGSSSGPKQYADLDGEPLLSWAIRAFQRESAVRRIVVVLTAADCSRPPEWLATLGVGIVPGGPERSDSVRNGLAALEEDTEIVLVHDAARPFVAPALIARVIAAASEGGAIPGLPVTDTVKQVDHADFVVGTVDRAHLRNAQTPQGFSYPVLVAAHRRAAEEGWRPTDDAALCERIGVAVRVVEGDPRNLKVTHPFDLYLARCIAPSIRRPDGVLREPPPGA